MEAHILSTIILTKHQIKALIFQAICLNGLSSQVQLWIATLEIRGPKDCSKY